MNETSNRLGSIEKVDIREAWRTEGSHFTPWLEREIKILNETLGVEIEIKERESNVGDFKADLFGKELNLNTNVIIENQFGKTDHDHLGKLLTYSAGKDAGIIIWIAENFREKHRSVLDWLNESSGEDRSFFGVEIEVVKIGESQLAPNFKVVSKPNEWEKTVSHDDQEVTERGQKYKEFWKNTFELIQKNIPNFTSSRTPQAQNWMSVGAGKTGVHYELGFKKGKNFQISLRLESDDAEVNDRYFNQLKKYKDEIDEIINGDVIWEGVEDVKHCYIGVNHSDIDIEDSEERLTDVQNWAIERIKEFKKAFDDKIRRLD